MILNPVQRRYGYGAARLLLQRPLGGISMSELARRPVGREARFAAMPLLVCTGVALLLAMVGRLEPQPPAYVDSVPIKEAPPIAIEFWQEVTPRIEEAIAAPSLPPSPRVDATPAPDRETSRFGPSVLAIRPIAEPIRDATYAPEPVNERRPGARSSRPRPELDIATFRLPMPARFDSNHAGRDAHGIDAARPLAITRPQPAEAQPQWSASQDRRAYLATLDAESTSTPAISNAAPRPHVAAALRPASRTHGNPPEAAWVGLAAGWHEVPIDELPDCRPAGRQDLLKKRILLAAPFERECSHQYGSYRFVETRNLGAFLMWSRPNPDQPAGHQRVRDVCEALEQALRCLDQASNKESSAQ